jgi:hypothetical protein
MAMLGFSLVDIVTCKAGAYSLDGYKISRLLSHPLLLSFLNSLCHMA